MKEIPKGYVVLLMTCNAQKDWSSARPVGLFTEADVLYNEVIRLINAEHATMEDNSPLKSIDPEKIQDHVDFIITKQFKLNELSIILDTKEHTFTCPSCNSNDSSPIEPWIINKEPDDNEYRQCNSCGHASDEYEFLTKTNQSKETINNVESDEYPEESDADIIDGTLNDMYPEPDDPFWTD